MKTFKLILSVVLVFLVLGSFGCVESSESGGIETGNAGSNLAAAAASLFSSDENGAQLKAQAVLEALAQTDGDMGPRSACDVPDDQAPTGVSMTLSITPGTYGTSDNSVTVAASDGCDQGGEYAGFQVNAHDLICTGGDGARTTLTMQESSGIFRENLELERTEIYGTFTLTDGTNVETDIRCSLTIDRSQRFGGGCEDASGTTIEQSSETTCVDDE